MFNLPEEHPVYAFFADVSPCHYDPEKALKDFDALTPEQKANEADQEFEKASASAANAVQNIETMFVTLTVKLTSLGDTRRLLAKLAKIKKIFRVVVNDSLTLAVTIAQYADSQF